MLLSHRQRRAKLSMPKHSPTYSQPGGASPLRPPLHSFRGPRGAPRLVLPVRVATAERLVAPPCCHPDLPKGQPGSAARPGPTVPAARLLTHSRVWACHRARYCNTGASRHSPTGTPSPCSNDRVVGPPLLPGAGKPRALGKPRARGLMHKGITGGHRGTLPTFKGSARAGRSISGASSLRPLLQAATAE